jgi:hypothetical protein
MRRASENVIGFHPPFVTSAIMRILAAVLLVWLIKKVRSKTHTHPLIQTHSCIALSCSISTTHSIRANLV